MLFNEEFAAGAGAVDSPPKAGDWGVIELDEAGGGGIEKAGFVCCWGCLKVLEGVGVFMLARAASDGPDVPPDTLR